MISVGRLVSRVNRVSLFGFFVFCSLSSIGQSSFGAALVHYPQATEVIHSSVTTDDYLLALGALKKINGQWKSDREERIGGTLTRSTRELDSGHDVTEVFEYYRRQLLQMGAREIFLCHARKCGSSNSWANNRFGIKQLYGLDQHQRYSVFALLKDEVTEYVVLYGVLRGNKRSYIHVDSIESSVSIELFSSREVIESQLQTRQGFVIADVGQDGLSAEQVKALSEALRRNGHWQVAIVGVNREPAKLNRQLERSAQAAEAIEGQLIAVGIDATRLTAQGIGSLVPASLSFSGRRAVVFSLVDL